MAISKLGASLAGALLCALFAFGLAAADTPVRLAITDLEGLEQIQREFGGFRDRLAKDTGMPIDFYAVPNRTAAVEAMNAKKVDPLLGPDQGLRGGRYADPLHAPRTLPLPLSDHTASPFLVSPRGKINARSNRMGYLRQRCFMRHS